MPATQMKDPNSLLTTLVSGARLLYFVAICQHADINWVGSVSYLSFSVGERRKAPAGLRLSAVFFLVLFLFPTFALLPLCFDARDLLVYVQMFNWRFQLTLVSNILIIEQCCRVHLVNTHNSNKRTESNTLSHNVKPVIGCYQVNCIERRLGLKCTVSL